MTYGAGGSTREKTVELVERIQREMKIRSMAHLTCVGHTADEIGRILTISGMRASATCWPYAAIRPAGRASSLPPPAALPTPIS